MLKDKHYAEYFAWWNYWISKVPYCRDVRDGSAGPRNSKAEPRADRAQLIRRLRRKGTLPGDGLTENTGAMN